MNHFVHFLGGTMAFLMRWLTYCFVLSIIDDKVKHEKVNVSYGKRSKYTIRVCQMQILKKMFHVLFCQIGNDIIILLQRKVTDSTLCWHSFHKGILEHSGRFSLMTRGLKFSKLHKDRKYVTPFNPQ